MELRVGGKYRLGRKIGSGSFGDIYLGESYDDETVETFGSGRERKQGKRAVPVCAHWLCEWSLGFRNLAIFFPH